MTTPKGVKETAKASKMDESLPVSDVLSAIVNESHRPSAIVGILRRKYDQNTVLRTLLTLEKEGKVERDTKKAWIARGGVKQQKKEKEKAKPKDKESGERKEKQKE